MKTAGRRRHEGAVRRAEDQTDDREPADGAAAAVQRRAGCVSSGADPASRRCGVLAAIGCQKMMVVLPASSPLPKDEQRKIVRDRLAAISEVLQKSNVRLGHRVPRRSTVPDGTSRRPANESVHLESAGDASRSRKTAARTSASILDVWHWHHSGSTIDDILAAGKDRIVHVHVSDAKAQPPEEVRDNQRVMPGEGVINLVGFFQALKKIGYDGGVSPEPLGRVPPEMSPEEGAKLALDTTMAVMKKAGVV